MTLPKMSEEIIYQAVERGELEIDEMGRVWRIKLRTGTRWGKGAVNVPCEKRRAEHDIGTYLQIRVMVNWKRTYCMAHRLVWRHFSGAIPEGMAINHKNGNKKDNRPDNLEVVTYSGNTRHMLEVLQKGRVLHQNGMDNLMAKLNEQAILEIRALSITILAEMKSRNGHKISELAEKYGVSYSTVWNVIRLKTWGSIS